MFKATVYVRMKKGLLDPQGKAIEGAFRSLGFTGVDSVSVGKLVEFNIKAKSRMEATHKINDMCKKLLANPTIEVASHDLEEIK
jgi:phosphoribosylformylglycinamidine synthase subunit PurS